MKFKRKKATFLQILKYYWNLYCDFINDNEDLYVWGEKMSYVVLETFDKSQSEQAFLKCNLLNKNKSPASRVSYKFFIIRNKNKLKLCEEKEIEEEIKEDLKETNKTRIEKFKRLRLEKEKENLKKIIDLLSQGNTYKKCGETMNLTLQTIYNYTRRWKNGIYKDFEIKYDPKIHDFQKLRRKNDT